jgi:arsenate reductase-like glutaredoxin family protein
VTGGGCTSATEYANKRIIIAVVDIEDDRPTEDELAAAYHDAAESARDWNQASEEPWESLGPTPCVEGYDDDE